MHEITRQRLVEMKARREKTTFKVSRSSSGSETARRFNKLLNKSKVGTFLAVDIKWLTGIKGGEGCGCKNLADEMNRKGPDWCEKNIKYIQDKMVKNRNALAKVTGVPESILGTKPGLVALKAGAYILVTNAIRKDRIRHAKQEEELKSS
jgi:hypothetical protein